MKNRGERGNCGGKGMEGEWMACGWSSRFVREVMGPLWLAAGNGRLDPSFWLGMHGWLLAGNAWLTAGRNAWLAAGCECQ